MKDSGCTNMQQNNVTWLIFDFPFSCGIIFKSAQPVKTQLGPWSNFSMPFEMMKIMMIIETFPVEH